MSSLDWVVGFDTETTGIDTLNDRIVTASIAYIDPVGNLIQGYDWLINPEVAIPAEATAVHGITDLQAQMEGTQPATAIYEMAGVLAYFMSQRVPVVAFNASYDFSILDAEIRRHLLYSNGFADFFANKEIPPFIIDPYVIDKRLDKYRTGLRTLTASADRLGVKLENAHTAFDDCVAAVAVARALWEKYPVLNEGPVEDLYEAQASWYAAQQESLAAYYRRTGKDDNVSTSWPIRTE